MAVDFYNLFNTKYPTGPNQIWVDQATGNDSNPGTSTLPKATIQAGVSAVGSTGRVWVRNGNYYNVQISGKNGSPGNWIQVAAQSGHAPKVLSDTNSNTLAVSGSSYIAIYGFESRAVDAPGYEYSHGPHAYSSHHVAFWKMWIHHCASGVGAVGGAGVHHIDVCYNMVGPRTGRYLPQAASAIAVWILSDGGNDADGYANRIIGNVAFDSMNDPSTAASDGNGIIVDANSSIAGQGGSTVSDKTLVAFNLTVYNGGRGIHSFGSPNVDIVFNTTAHNIRALYNEFGVADFDHGYQTGSNNKAKWNVSCPTTADIAWYYGEATSPVQNTVLRGNSPSTANNYDKRSLGEGYFQSPNDLMSNVAGWRPVSATNQTVDLNSVTDGNTFYNILKDWPDYFGDLRPGTKIWSTGFTEPAAGGGGGSAPVANFTATPNPATPGQTIQFTDTSTNAPTGWAWNFGDGTTSTVKNPTKIYSQAGSYTVSLTATNGTGSNAKTMQVTVGSAGATVWYEAESATLGGGVEVPQVSSTNPGYVGSGYVGFFGRTGNYVEFTIPGATAGSYQLQMRWGRMNDGSALPSRLIKVNGSSIATVAFPAGQQVSDWADPNRFVLSDAVQVTLTGGTNTIRIEFAGSGDWEYVDLDRIGLTALGSPGSPPVANFGWSPASPVAGDTVAFNDQSTNGPTSWSWNFGDSTTSTSQNPTKSYAAAGTYVVQLTSTNSAGSNTVQKSVTVDAGGGTQDPTTDSLQVTGNVLLNLTTYTAHVQVRDRNGLLGEDFEQFTTLWSQPAAPTSFTVTP